MDTNELLPISKEIFPFLIADIKSIPQHIFQKVVDGSATSEYLRTTPTGAGVEYLEEYEKLDAFQHKLRNYIRFRYPAAKSWGYALDWKCDWSNIFPL